MTDIAAPRSARRLRTMLALAGLAVLAAAVLGIYAITGEHGATGSATSQRGVGWSDTPRAMPDLRFQDGDGKPHALSDFRGKLVLLNLWATWCAPCREEMPALDRLEQTLGGPDFQVIALSLDSSGAATVRRFYDEIGIRKLAIFVDPSMEATGKLRTVGIPTTVLVDREGLERWRKTGPAEWDSPEMIESLRAKLHGGGN